MSKIHPEILDKERLSTFQKLTNFKNFGYLAGGTALALQIKHRKSFDFDIFTNKQINTTLKFKIKNIFGDVNYYVNSKDQISFSTKQNINITFLWYYFPIQTKLIPNDTIPLASIQDIATDKSHTIGRRAAWRDYVDIFFLLKQKYITLDTLINLSDKKFKGEFNEALFLQQLTYFKDIEITPIDFITDSYTPHQIQSALEYSVEQYTKKII